MSRWENQFFNHPIHDTIKQLESWADVDPNDWSEGDIQELRRLRKVITLVDEALQYCDAETVAFQKLDELNNQLHSSNIWQQLKSFATNSNIEHVKNVNNNIDVVLNQLHTISTSEPMSSEQRKVFELEKTIDSSIESLVKKKKQLTEDIDVLKNNLSSLSGEKDELEETIEQRRQEVDSQISQWQQQFSEAQEKRSSGYSEWREKIDTELKKKSADIVKEFTEKIDVLKENSEATLKDTVSNAKDKHQEIVNLFQLASGDSISGGYAQSANKERFQSNMWRGIAILFIGLTAWWLISAYSSTIERNDRLHHQSVLTTEKSTAKNIHGNDVNFDWSAFLFSVSLTGVLLYGAAFSSLQSNRHRENEKQMRWFALQIKALDPYISSLNEEDQKELKKALSEKFFTSLRDDDKQENIISEHAVNTLGKAMADVIKASKS